MLRAPEELCGFTAGRSCSDNIFVLRHLMEKRLDKKKEVHFVDLEQAFDNMPRQRMCQCLEEAGVSRGLLSAIKNYTKGMGTK